MYNCIKITQCRYIVRNSETVEVDCELEEICANNQQQKYFKIDTKTICLWHYD